MAELDEMIQKNNLFFRQLLFLAVLVLIGAIVVRELSFFVGSFLGAITLYVVFRPWQYKLVDRFHWKPWIASLLMVAFATIILIGLMLGVFRVVSSELITFDFTALIPMLDRVVNDINEHLPFNLIPATYIEDSTSFLTKGAGTIIQNTYSFVINILFMLLILYFMLANSRRMEHRLGRYNPFKGESRELMNAEVSSIIYSNAIGIPIIMLGQGLAAALIYWLFGMQHIAFWAFLTAVAGLIPVVGSILVSVPLGISFIMAGEVLQGILLMVCGLLVIANVDNLLRIILNQKMTNTHPLVVIFGVLMGIPFFGFWGIIFGPLLISIFLLLIKIYYREFKLMSKQEVDAENLEDISRHGGHPSGFRSWKKKDTMDV